MRQELQDALLQAMKNKVEAAMKEFASMDRQATHEEARQSASRTQIEALAEFASEHNEELRALAPNEIEEGVRAVQAEFLAWVGEKEKEILELYFGQKGAPGSKTALN